MSEAREPYVLPGDARRAEHTPGPWRVDRDTSDDPFTMILAGAATIVGEAYESTSTEEQILRAEANARLMAAAPEMADLLLRWWRLAGDHPIDVARETLDLLRSAGVQP